MAILASDILSGAGGSGGNPKKLAVDLDWPIDRTNRGLIYQQIASIDGTSGLATALSITGEGVVTFLQLGSLDTENMRVKLTLDSVVVWDATETSNTGNDWPLIGSSANVGDPFNDIGVFFDTSFLLEVETIADTNVNVLYLARALV